MWSWPMVPKKTPACNSVVIINVANYSARASLHCAEGLSEDRRMKWLAQFLQSLAPNPFRGILKSHRF